jgi:hypothetical protein
MQIFSLIKGIITQGQGLMEQEFHVLRDSALYLAQAGLKKC